MRAVWRAQAPPRPLAVRGQKERSTLARCRRVRSAGSSGPSSTASAATSGSALAFEFLVLTAARTNEVIGARWDEIDRKGKIWTVPAARIKAGREHRVPLSKRSLEF